VVPVPSVTKSKSERAEELVCPHGRGAQKAFWLIGVHDRKAGSWNPHAVCGRSLIPGEDNSQKPEC